MSQHSRLTATFGRARRADPGARRITPIVLVLVLALVAAPGSASAQIPGSSAAGDAHLAAVAQGLSGCLHALSAGDVRVLEATLGINGGQRRTLGQAAAALGQPAASVARQEVVAMRRLEGIGRHGGCSVSKSAAGSASPAGATPRPAAANGASTPPPAPRLPSSGPTSAGATRSGSSGGWGKPSVLALLALSGLGLLALLRETVKAVRG